MVHDGWMTSLFESPRLDMRGSHIEPSSDDKFSYPKLPLYLILVDNWSLASPEVYIVA